MALLVAIGSHGAVAEPDSTREVSEHKAVHWKHAPDGSVSYTSGTVEFAATNDETTRRAVADAARCAWLAGGTHSQWFLGWMVELEPWMGQGDRPFTLSPFYTYPDGPPRPDPEVIFYGDLGSCPTGAHATGASAESGSEEGVIPHGSTHALVILTVPQELANVTIERPIVYPCYLTIVCVERGVRIRAGVFGGRLHLAVRRT